MHNSNTLLTFTVQLRKIGFRGFPFIGNVTLTGCFKVTFLFYYPIVQLVITWDFGSCNISSSLIGVTIVIGKMPS